MRCWFQLGERGLSRHHHHPRFNANLVLGGLDGLLAQLEVVVRAEGFAK
jgi:hypothetical protein